MESTTEGPVEPASSGLFSHFLSILSSIGTIWTFLLVLLICFDVIARSFFNKPIAGVTEIAGASLIAIVYLNIASSINSRRLTRADILIDVIGMRWPRLRSGIEAVFDIVGLLVFSLIARAGAREALESFQERDYFGIEGVFTLVRWPFWAILVAGCGLGAITFLLSAIAHISAALRFKTESAT